MELINSWHSTNMLTGLKIVASLSESAGSEGVMIPLDDFGHGLTLEELDADSLIQLEAKFLYSFLEKVHSVLSPTTFEKLGITVARDTSDAGSGIVNFDFSLTGQYLEALNARPTPLPIPTTGTNLGVGDFTFTSIFPNAQKVAAVTQIDTCVFIPTASLDAYGAPSHATLNLSTDSRAYLMALYRALASESTLRAIDTPSAIISRVISTPSIVVLPLAATSALNPTTAIQTGLIPSRAKVTQNTFSISIQTQLAPSSMSYEVHVI